jgi:hypothetical protein
MPTTSKGFRYPLSSASPNVPADMQNLASDVDTFFGVWADYTPTTGFTNTTVTSAKWRRIGGKTIQVEFLLTLSGTPTGTFALSLPATAGFATANRLGLEGSVLMRDNDTTNFRLGIPVLSSTTTLAILAGPTEAVAGGTVTTTVPWTWAVNDTLGGMFSYREA